VEAQRASWLGSRNGWVDTARQIVDIVDGAGIDVATPHGILRLQRVRIDEGPDLWADTLPKHCTAEPGQRFTWTAAPPGWCYTGLRRMVAPEPFESTLQVGQRVSMQLFALSAAGSSVSVRHDGRIESQQQVDASRWTASTDYAFDTAGTHTPWWRSSIGRMGPVMCAVSP